jgi:hypothetical protein
MAIDPTPEPLPHVESEPDSSLSLQGQATTEAVVTLPWGSLCCDRVVEDWAYLLVSIRACITFDEWSAVVIARTVEHGEYVDPQDLGGHPNPATSGHLKTGHHRRAEA